VTHLRLRDFFGVEATEDFDLHELDLEVCIENAGDIEHGWFPIQVIEGLGRVEEHESSCIGLLRDLMGKEEGERVALSFVDKDRLESGARLVLDDQFEIFAIHRHARLIVPVFLDSVGKSMALKV
jgi:hypothetical protein